MSAQRLVSDSSAGITPAVADREYESFVRPSARNGSPSLHYAVYADNMAEVKRIVQQRGRAALKDMDKLKHTALHVCCFFGKVGWMMVACARACVRA